MKSIGKIPVKHIFLIVVLSTLALGSSVGFVQAQDNPAQVQEINGKYDLGDGGIIYELPDLKKGQVLSVYAEGTSGNFDPFIGLLDAQSDITQVSDAFTAEVEAAIQQNRDPLLVVPEFADQAFLAWNDDIVASLAASFSFTIPQDGDYQLIITSTPLSETFGAYRLLIGLDAPEVASGSAAPTGDTIATFLRAGRNVETAVQAVRGELTTNKPATFYDFNDFFPGDTLYVYIESLGGNLSPRITLKAQGTKPVRNGNYNEDTTQGWFEFYLPEGGSGYQVEISAASVDGVPTSGEYRLLVGRNVPDVLTGSVPEQGQPFLRLPIVVDVGAKLQQITDVDQTAENYGGVYAIQLKWQDPALAFNPEECQCEYKIFSGDDFAKFASAEGVNWPIFTVINQQGNRWIQNKIVVVYPTGNAVYLERFSTTLQAPDFNFRQFPFDKQEFFLAIDSLYPAQFFTYQPSEEFFEVGQQLGEEEWYVVDAQASVSEEQVSTQSVTPRYEFRFFAQRHLTFYIFRIFVPLILIIVVAWITFFMEDYGKRVDATTANLLLFIAFNFTISSNLPRLGYLTYLDTLLVCTFLVSVLVVAYNVFLKRLENKGQRERADRVDKYVIWLYPLGYAIAFSLVTLWFFVF